MVKAGEGKGVIFDLDGVLIDSAPAHKQSWYDLAAKEGYPMSDEFFYKTFGMQNFQVLPMLAGKELAGPEMSKLSDWKERRYREIFSETINLVQGAERLLNELKAEGFLLAIGSSTTKENIDFVMDKLKIERFFDTIVTSKDVTKGKPAPDIFLTAAKRLSLNPGDCIVIEDSLPGIEAAKAAKMSVIALTTTRDREELTEANVIVNSLDELKVKDFVTILRAKAA